MKNSIYYSAMFFLVACFVPLVLILRTLELGLFATQISIFMILLVFSGITLFMLTVKKQVAWSFSIFIFSLHLMNAVYLFFFNLNLNLVIYSVIALLGLIYSLYNVDFLVKKEISTRIKVLKKPKKLNKIEEKVSNKTSKKVNKKVSKKTSKKKRKSKK